MRKFILVILTVGLVFLALTYISVSETKSNFRTCIVLQPEDIDHLNFRDFDSVTVSANLLYKASFLKKVMQGEHYRAAWAAPVNVPIVYLDTLKGGLKFIETGGGKQTHSLEFEDSLGIRYTFRSLSKDPKKLVPNMAKNLGLDNIIVDGISAQHPYAALVVAQLSNTANILHTNPRLMFVPKQEVLDNLNDKYGNRLYFFEYENKGTVNWTAFDNVYEIMDTDGLLEFKMEQGNRVILNHNALIRARLFDLLIGDWDRHAKQWGWVIERGQGKFLVTPLPTDRDNAFFNHEGILPTLVVNEYTLEEVQDFEKKISFLPGLVLGIDEYFLRTATMKQFETEAQYLKMALSNENIEKAFKVWPKQVDSLDGKAIREKLKSRRDNLTVIAKQFYEILQHRPIQNVVLKGCEDLELNDELIKCFDCFE